MQNLAPYKEGLAELNCHLVHTTHMKNYKSIFIAYIFLTIFFAKMVISIAPVIVAEFDATMVKAVIMQLELETHSEKETGKTIKFSDLPNAYIQHSFSYDLSAFTISLDNDFIENYKRYVKTYHPRVPTPPPNLV